MRRSRSPPRGTTPAAADKAEADTFERDRRSRTDCAGGGALRMAQKKESSGTSCSGAPRRTAATYSPTWSGSTIGDDGLSFSVRNGKRRFPVAIATAIYNLRELQRKIRFPLFSYASLSLKERYRAISTGQLRPSPALHFLPIDVVVSHDPLWKSHLGDGFALRCFQRLS